MVVLDNNTHAAVILLLIIVVLCTCRSSNRRNMVEGFIDVPETKGPIRWTRDKTCRYMMTKTMRNVLNEYGIEKAKDGEDWTLYFPCGYNKINDAISRVEPTSNDQRVFVIHNADQVSGKQSIWRNLYRKYGESAEHLMPKTFILYDDNDVKRFKKCYDKKKTYIMKKNIQRQKGLCITRNKKKILDGRKKGYVVVQEMLMDPYIIDRRKINMRFYLLIVCKDGEVSGFVHRNGFMYYTKVPFVKDSLDEGPNITTGYIDRKVYEKNPLTLEDFREYLDDTNRDLNKAETSCLNKNESISETVFARIHNLLEMVVIALEDNVCKGSSLKRNYTFQLFGADVALNDKLEPHLIEVNKGPDMGAKDDRDREVKNGVMRDVFRIVKAVPDDKEECQFIAIH